MIDQEAVKAELGTEESQEESQEQNQEESQEQNQEESQEQEPKLSNEQQRAYAKGWRPKDQFHGDPDDWNSATQFNKIGGLIDRVQQQSDQMRGMKSNFDERLNNVNVMHKSQLEGQQKQLDAQFNDAVENGDTKKASDIRDQQVSVNTQLNQVNTPSVSPNNDKQYQAEWESKNPWIYESSDKASVAKGTFSNALSLGKSIPEAIQAAEEAIKPYNKPAGNRNRAAPAAMSSGRSGGRGNQDQLSMADVTHQEGQMRGMFKDEKSFLKAVQDSRVGI